ncbi:MAG: DNA-3-methyladenine glycosylase [Chloroflexi bacterium]|nr:DNA-3-methyladenine glycosylase [Chloroflexota bacterium]
MKNAARLTRDFFEQPTLQVAINLLGQHLVRIRPGHARVAGVIVETEAYIGSEDLACHARSGKTARNMSMWGDPGRSYVYFVYGMHWMLNIVTASAGLPAAVLIRSIFPLEGIEQMARRRNNQPLEELANGPAKLCQAFDIDGALDGHDLCNPESKIFIEAAETPAPESVTSGPRVGLNSVPEPWKSKPWRFCLNP